jgi:hypothetical protein
VRTSARTQLNVTKMRIGGCRWMVGDAVEGQLSLAMSEVVGKVATMATGPIG